MPKFATLDLSNEHYHGVPFFQDPWLSNPDLVVEDNSNAESSDFSNVITRHPKRQDNDESTSL